jgi:hypothetical protein
MSGRAAKQRNGYVGNPPRAWLRVTVGALGGPERELCVVVDTGNPCALIVGLEVFREFLVDEAGDITSNFGLLQGGWLDVTIGEVGFRGRVQAYGNDQVATAVQHSDRRFLGLAGLPLLRKLEYGGDADAFWLRRPAAPRSAHKRKP